MNQISDSVWPPDITKPIGKRPVILGVIAFDGTWNNKYKPKTNEHETIVGHVYDVLEKNDSIKIRYYHPGAGTQPSLIDAAIGFSLKSTARTAAKNILDQVIILRQKQPNADVRLLVTGFSRGAATARHFMNTFEKYWKSGPRTGSNPKFYAILFDTVQAQLIENLDLSVPVDADMFYHYVSQDERRILFKPVLDKPLSDSEGRIVTIPRLGVHSDIRGSYSKGIGLEYTTDIDIELAYMGLLPAQCYVVENDIRSQGKHDSRGLLEKLAGISALDASSDIRNRNPIYVPMAPFSSSDQLEWKKRMIFLRSDNIKCKMEESVALPHFILQRTTDYLREKNILTVRVISGESDKFLGVFKDPNIYFYKGKYLLGFSSTTSTKNYTIKIPSNIIKKIKINDTINLYLLIIESNKGDYKYL